MSAGAVVVSPGSRSGPSELERPKPNTDKQGSSSAGGKKTAAKLRMALSLLRRKSNQNLRKAYVEPVDETAEGWNALNNAVGATPGVAVVTSLLFLYLGMLTIACSLCFRTRYLIPTRLNQAIPNQPDEEAVPPSPMASSSRFRCGAAAAPSSLSPDAKTSRDELRLPASVSSWARRRPSMA